MSNEEPVVGSVDRLCVKPDTAAELLDCSRQHIYNLMSQGRLRRVKIGRSARIPFEDLVALIEGDR